jgi:hypothetical protein
VKHKIRFLSAVLSICLLSIVSFGQGSNIDIDISLETIKFSNRAKKTPVKVKITNLSAADLNVGDVKYISFFLLKWNSADFYISPDNVFKLDRKTKSRVLKQNESIEFSLNLAKLAWYDQILFERKKRKKFKALSPATYNFFAVTDVNNNFIKAKPSTSSFLSNRFDVKFISK